MYNILVVKNKDICRIECVKEDNVKKAIMYCSPFDKLGLSWNYTQSQLAFTNSYV